ncbi:MAG: transposase [Planctomycetota bacterium]
MEPLEFMARLAALVPPPRHPLGRYHGVFAPNSPWRGAVIPAAPSPREPRCASAGAPADGAEKTSPVAALPAPQERGGAAVEELCTVPEEATKPTRPATRIDLATLLRRVWNVDALKCPRCEGAMKFIATITDRAVIVRILEHLRLPTDEVAAAPA